MDLKEIGQIIKERRAVMGVNQRTVSELSGVAVNTLVAIERGKRNPQITTLLDILNTIGLQLDVKPKVMEYETMSSTSVRVSVLKEDENRQRKVAHSLTR